MPSMTHHGGAPGYVRQQSMDSLPPLPSSSAPSRPNYNRAASSNQSRRDGGGGGGGSRPPGPGPGPGGAGLSSSATLNRRKTAILQRSKTLTRPERQVAPVPLINPHQATLDAGIHKPKVKNALKPVEDLKAWWDPWTFFSLLVTCWAPPKLLDAFGKKDSATRQAWREKIALCFIALVLGGVVGFITIGLNRVLCPANGATTPDQFLHLGEVGGYLGIGGFDFNVSNSLVQSKANFFDLAKQLSGQDITGLFDRSSPALYPACNGITAKYATSNLCAVQGDPNAQCPLGALTPQTFSSLRITNSTKQVGYAWSQVSDFQSFFVIDGAVLNLSPYMAANPTAIPNDPVDVAIRYVLTKMDGSGGKDATRLFFNRQPLQAAVPCLTQRYHAGRIDKITPGCFVSQLFLYFSLIVILGVVLARFFMAVIFSWFLASRLVKPPRNLKRQVISPAVMPDGANMEVNNPLGTAPWVTKDGRVSNKNGPGGGGGGNGGALKKSGSSKSNASYGEKSGSGAPAVDSDGMISMASIGAELFCVCLVTCYSEGKEGIQTTLDSIAGTDYSDARKLLFVVCDGMITGSGEKMSTPDICVEMLEADPRFGNPQAMSYLAVGSGTKEHNMAMVYAGHYTNVKGHRTPTMVVVKCGTPDEAKEKKPGNRGKRDSQMVLMNFFSRITYNDRMTPLDYDLFRKFQSLMGVTPDFFEVCLMVDADTKVYPDSLKQLVNCMQHDNMIMGVCGETRIANKRQSWVTAIQVYEYFISHHLAKAFESVFGGVTCLPGCFSMYRLKARRFSDGDWIPILAQPAICTEYSQSVVTTLHQKNLLLLGEDRFLTTLMIRTFPNRKMMFCPQARCRTVAPDTFRVLLSQRRRWINSTIHNLMELVRVPNLCGTFCFSMQFVIFMELIGTVVLPVAICLTYTLIVNYCFNPPKQFSDAIPLMLLGAVLGLPAILILITTRKVVYVSWMLVYLLALPVWNFILPVFAFSKFDDFSWGETRKVEGEGKDTGHEGGGAKLGANTVPRRRWEDWERSRLRKLKREEKRRREFERAFGQKSLQAPSVLDGDDGASRMDETASMSSYEDDRWGVQIGYYPEAPTNQPPPVGLYSVDARHLADGQAAVVGHSQLEMMLDAGWGDEDDDEKEPVSPRRPQQVYPLADGGPGGNSFSTLVPLPTVSYYSNQSSHEGGRNPSMHSSHSYGSHASSYAPPPTQGSSSPYSETRPLAQTSALDSTWRGHAKKRSGSAAGGPSALSPVSSTFSNQQPQQYNTYRI